MGDPVSTAHRTDRTDLDDATNSQSGEHAERAPTHSEMTALLRRVAASARPGENSETAIAHVLRVLRRCPWVEGELRAELAGEGDATRLDLFIEIGGVRVRALAPVELDVPFAELVSNAMNASHLFAPLCVSQQSGRLVIACPPTDEKPTMKVPYLADRK